MKNRIMLTKPVFEWLIEHLVFIEENTDELVNFYYPGFEEEKYNMKKFFIEYIRKIEVELEKVEVIGSFDKFHFIDYLNVFPFVIIGSQVSVRDVLYKKEACYKLIHPVEHSRRKNEITYLSALGKALLLKEAGSEVMVNTPAGMQHFRIQSVKLL